MGEEELDRTYNIGIRAIEAVHAGEDAKIRKAIRDVMAEAILKRDELLRVIPARRNDAEAKGTRQDAIE